MRVRRSLVAAAAAALVATCLSLVAGPAAVAGAASPRWIGAGGDDANSGFDAAEPSITTANVGTLTQAWSKPPGLGRWGGTYADGRFYGGCRDDDPSTPAYLCALDATDGHRIWSSTQGNVSPSPSLDADQLIVTWGGAVRALDLGTGAVRWETRVSEDTYAVRMVKATTAGVFAEDDHGRLHLLDRTTGAVRWTYTYPELTGSSTGVPAVSGSTFFLGHNGVVEAHDVATGALLWISGSAGGQPTVAGDLVLAGTTPWRDDPIISAFPAAGCGAAACPARWTAVVDDRGYVGGIAAHDGIVATAGLGGTQDGLLGLDLATGAVRWKVPGIPVQSEYLAITGDVVFGSLTDGDVVAASLHGCGAATCPLLWRVDEASQTLRPPTIGAGTVLTGTGVAYRLPRGPVPVGAWYLEGSGSTAEDGSGHGLTGTADGGVTPGIAGPMGDRAAQFRDGSYNVADAPALHLDGAFTIDLWARVDAFVNDWPGLLNKGDQWTDGWSILYAGDGRVKISRRNKTATTNAGVLTAGNGWHHFTLTYDGTRATWYVDGAKDSTTTVSWGSSTSTRPLQIGRGSRTGHHSFDDVQLFDRVVVPATSPGGGPQATITSGPPASTSSTQATFTFTSNPAGASFSCQLDDRAASPCTSPATYAGLATGTHHFTVTAVDAFGPTGTPATATWQVTAAAPSATIDSAPSGTTTSTTATITFHPTSASCSLDGAPQGGCTSPVTYSGLAPGHHTFSVWALDAFGNGTGTPATAGWDVAAGPAPIGWWRLDGNGSDATGRHADGGPNGGIAPTAGPQGPATQFRDGSYNVADAPDLHLDGAFTIDLWARVDDFVNDWPGLLNKGDQWTDGWSILYAGDGRVKISRRNKTATTNVAVLTAGSGWHRFTLTYDGTRATWYVDGVKDSTTTVSWGSSTSTRPLQIGRGSRTGHHSLDEVKLFDSVVPPT